MSVRNRWQEEGWRPSAILRAKAGKVTQLQRGDKGARMEGLLMPGKEIAI